MKCLGRPTGLLKIVVVVVVVVVKALFHDGDHVTFIA